MCGRFYVDDDILREIEKIVRGIDAKRAKRGEVYPSEPAVVLHTVKDSENTQGLAEFPAFAAAVMEWGYKAPGKGTLIFNARSESVRERPMFRHDYEVRRCVVPVKKFYEWKRLSSKEKKKYEFLEPGQLLYLAGIYHRDPQGDRFTILTRKAAGCMEGIHDRMPVILEREKIEDWLYSRETADLLLENTLGKLVRQSSGPMEYEQLRLF